MAGSTAPTAAPSGPIDVQSGDFPDTPVTATLEKPYRTQSATFDAAMFGVASGAITAAWYVVGDSWAVYYRGLTKEQALGKCPGNSIKTATGFEDISNSPYGALACKNHTDTVLPPGSLHLCGDKAVVYTTQIPKSAVGTLYGSLEQGLDDGSIQGMSSQVIADASGAPAIDVSRCQVVS